MNPLYDTECVVCENLFLGEINSFCDKIICVSLDTLFGERRPPVLSTDNNNNISKMIIDYVLIFYTLFMFLANACNHCSLNCVLLHH